MSLLTSIANTLRSLLGSLQSQTNLILVGLLNVVTSLVYKLVSSLPLSLTLKTRYKTLFVGHQIKDTRKHQYVSPNNYSWPFEITYVPNSFDITGFMRKLLTLRYWLQLFTYVRDIVWQTFGFAYQYKQGVVFLLFIDACLTDDEPLWEPIEWSGSSCNS